MRCFMCFSSDSKLQMIQGDMDNDTFKRITFILPDFAIPESQSSVIICAPCLEQVSFFHTIKKAGLQNSCLLKQFNVILKGTNNFKYDELSIKINNAEEPTEINHIEIKVEPNHEDVFLSEDTDPTHVMTKNKEYDFYRQQLVNVKSNLSYLQDDASCSSNNNAQTLENADKFTKKDSNLTSSESRRADQSKTQCESQTKGFKCSDCHKTFTQRCNLERHSRVHTGDKPFKCTTCQKTFTQRSSLITHKLTHTGDKPHECDVCHKTFNQKGNLLTHKRYHNNVRPFKCAVCSKRFTQSGHLSTHMFIHTGEKPHQCHLCEYKCTHASHLKTHIRRHTSEKPYSCKHCEKSFTNTSNLKVHKRRHHSNEDSD